jgi:putative FmdB family regulatory protein
MPKYDYSCPGCQHEEELMHSMSDCAISHACPKCSFPDMERIIKTARAVRPPVDGFWEYENGGRGRECTQFVDNRYKPGDKRATRYFRSQNEMIETAKREGYSVTRER